MATQEMVVDVSQDWVLACDVQQRFMQGLGERKGSLNYSARCRQLCALGGDCYDFMPLEGGRVGFVIGDASGKGLAAALMMASVQASLRTAALLMGDDLAGLMKMVNQLAYTSSLADRFATLFYGVFDTRSRTLRYVNAGHNPPLVLRRDGAVQWLEAAGAPVGMFADSRYQDNVVQLEPGDLVISYTDGVVEAVNRSGEEWGVDGLLEAAVNGARCSGEAEELVRYIFDSMDAFSEERRTDDATLAVVRVI